MKSIKDCIYIFCDQSVAQPLVLRELLLSFGSGSNASDKTKYLLAAAVSAVTFGITLSFHPVCQFAFMLSMRCRIACSSLIYRKVGITYASR